MMQEREDGLGEQVCVAGAGGVAPPIHCVRWGEGSWIQRGVSG